MNHSADDSSVINYALYPYWNPRGRASLLSLLLSRRAPLRPRRVTSRNTALNADVMQYLHAYMACDLLTSRSCPSPIVRRAQHGHGKKAHSDYSQPVFLKESLFWLGLLRFARSVENWRRSQCGSECCHRVSWSSHLVVIERINDV